VDRTALANERTLLSFVRTGLAFAAAGAGLIHFFDSVPVEVLGWLLLPFAIAITAIGVLRFLQMRRRISKIAVK
jgi:putative membrane protein